jgi:hypothetical protein
VEGTAALASPSPATTDHELDGVADSAVCREDDGGGDPERQIDQQRMHEKRDDRRET